jgi:AcrR family transcriptional regulator
MARPTTISTERIVEVARQVFLEHGFGVSTAAIARELGISEGSIYKRFATKDRLFQAAMGLPSCDFADAWPERAGAGAPRDTLLTIGRRLLAHFRELIPRAMMMHTQPCCSPWETLRHSEDPPPVVVARHLAGYLERERELGTLGDFDAAIAARMFMATVHSRVFFELIGAAAAAPRTSDDAYLEGVVDTLFEGIGR